MEKWIPCSKWLPEENGHYLITAKYGTGLYVTCDDYYVYGWDDWGEDVIAWMPLPEPYKGEDDDNGTN